MQDLIDQLSFLDFAEDEVMVYVSVLEIGTASVLQIAQKLNIPRTTIYMWVEQLKKKGLLKQVEIGKKSFFIAESPNKLLQIAEHKKLSINSTISSLAIHLEKLNAIHNLKNEKPRMYYREGGEALKEILQQTLEHEHIFIHCMSKQLQNHLGSWLVSYYDQLIQKMIFTQEIVSDSEDDQLYQKKYSSIRNEIICIPEKYATNVDYLIYGDTVVFITYKSGIPTMVIYEDQELAHFERVRFLLIWNMANELQNTENYTPINTDESN